MDKPAVLGGWYTDVKYLNKVGVARITIEIPKDLWERDQDVLGVPPSLDGAKKFVAVTRVTEEGFRKWAGACAPEGSQTEDSAAMVAATESAVKPKLRSNLAAILCEENADFRAWLRGQNPTMWAQCYADSESEQATQLLKWKLGIKSRKELDDPPGAPIGPKARAFDALTTDFAYRNSVRA